MWENAGSAGCEVALLFDRAATHRALLQVQEILLSDHKLEHFVGPSLKHWLS